MSYSKVLKDLIVSYIDGKQLASSTLKEKLRLTSPDVRYELLRDVRGVQRNTWTAVYKAAHLHDLEGLQVMLDGLSSEQNYDIQRITNICGSTALWEAAISTGSHSSCFVITEFLLSKLTSEQKFQLFAVLDKFGGNILHVAAIQNEIDVVQLILNSCTKEQKLQLLAERNKGGRSVADLSVPTLYTTTQELEETKKQLRDQKKVSVEQIQKLETALDVTGEELNTHKISSQVQVDELRIQNDQLKQELQQTNKALTDVKKTSDVQVETNLLLKKDKEEQTKVVEETKKDLAALQETSNKQIEELKKQQTQALEETKKGQEETKKELADVQKSNNELVVELVRRNMQLERDNNQQTQVIQALSARQAAMEQMLERLELEFKRPIVTDETGDQENEDY